MNGDGRHSGGAQRGIETTSLQLVMERLWEEETEAGSRVLRLETLRRLGGAEQIITSHLDKTMDAMTDEQREVAARIFHHLVTPGGQKLAQTVTDLAVYAEMSEQEVLPVLDKLSKDRILRSVAGPAGQLDGFRYEIAHDVLGRTILDWRGSYVASERQRAIEKELHDERRRARVSRLVAVLCLGLLVVAAVAFAFALMQNRTAQDRARRAESIAIAHQAVLDQNAALLAGVEAYRLWPSLDARSRILDMLQLNAGLPRLLVGHTRAVNGVAFSPDSEILASAGSDQGIVRLWDGATGRPLGEPLRGHEDVVTAVAWRPGGQTLASASRDSTVRLWDVSNPREVKELRTLGGHAGWANAVAFSRDGNLLASGDQSGTVRIWDVRDPERPRRRPNPTGGRHAGSVLGLAFSPNHDVLASGGADGTVRLWDVSGSGPSRALGQPLRRTGGDAATLAFSGADNLLAAGREDGSVTLWDVSSLSRPRFHRSLEGHTGAVTGVSFNDDGSVLVTGGADDSVVSWNLRMNPPQMFGPPRTHSDDVTGVAIGADGKLAASASVDSIVKLWTLEDDEALATALGSRTDSPEAGLGRDGAVAAADSNKGSVQVWNLRGLALDSGMLRSPQRPRPEATLPPDESDGYTVAYRGDLLAATDGTEFTLWDVKDPSRPRKHGTIPDFTTPHTSGVVVLALSRDGRLLASGSADTTVLWDVSNPARPKQLEEVAAGNVNEIAFNNAGSVLAAGNEEGAIRLWDIKDPARPRRLGRPWPLRGPGGGAVYALAFDPSGRTLASGGADQETVLWDITRPSRVERIGFPLPQSNSILALAFSPDGKVLAAGDGDSSIVLWDVPARRSLGLDLRVNAFATDAAIDTVEFDRSGQYLVSAGRRNPVVAWSSVLWSDDTETLRRYACRLAGRNLTSAEWRSLFAGTELAAKRRKTCPEWPLPD